MIDAISLKDLRNGEYIQFIKDTCTIVTNNDPAVLNVVTQHTALLAKGTELESLFKTAMANAITKELVDLDEQRDQIINGLGFVIKGYGYHFLPAIKSAANALNDNLKMYGTGIATQNLQGETATLTSLVGDWENKPDLTAAVTTLQLTNWLTELKLVNEKFATRYIQRTTEYAAANPENLKMKREETNQVYYELRKFIDAYSVINSGVAAYGIVTNQLNALINQYNTLLAGRVATETVIPPVTP